MDRADRVPIGTWACSFVAETLQLVPKYDTVCGAPAFGYALIQPALCVMWAKWPSLIRGCDGGG